MENHSSGNPGAGEGGGENRVKVAVPSLSPGGLEAPSSPHFGRCECFTIVEIRDGEIRDAYVASNPPHVQGGCLAPVRMVASEGAQAVIVQGIGYRPLVGFRQAGMEVYLGPPGTVEDAVRAFARGELEPLPEDFVCGGGGGGRGS